MIFNWLKNLILFPVEFFWIKYNEYKDENCIWKVIALFVLSLSGLILFVFLTLCGIEWILSNHIELVIFFFAIWWIYNYVHTKMLKTENQKMQQQELLQAQLEAEKRQQEEEAVKSYPVMRTIIYQTLKNAADNIGCIVPRVLAEIEIDFGKPYIISNNICFYQFRVSKVDIRTRYTTLELEEFKRILQNDIGNMIRRGSFPMVIQNHVDDLGHVHEAVQVDCIEDMDNFLLLQTAFYSPHYNTYLQNKYINEQNTDKNIGLLLDEKLEEELKNV